MGDLSFSLPVAPTCCGKPVGCVMSHGGCLYLRHPWKRAMVFADMSVRCQAKWIPDAWTGGVEQVQCALFHGHDGPCVVR